MMMFETSKHAPKTKKRCCVFKNDYKLDITKTLPMHVFVSYFENSTQ